MKLSELFRIVVRVVSALACFQLAAFAQSENRVIDKLSWSHEPIKVIKIKTKNKTPSLGQPFGEDDDWLRGFTITVENISDKAIARVEFELAFTRNRNGLGTDDHPNYEVSMRYGLDPADPGFQNLQSILPGRSIDIKLNELNLPIILRDLKDLGYPEKTRYVRIILNSVTFVDGTQWIVNRIRYPDPANPKHKIDPTLPDFGILKSIHIAVPARFFFTCAQCSFSGTHYWQI